MELRVKKQKKNSLQDRCQKLVLPRRSILVAAVTCLFAILMSMRFGEGATSAEHRGPAEAISRAVSEEEGPEILEIAPTNHYWLDIPQNRASLEKALGVSLEDWQITCVTPNTLNGLTTDLLAKYDLLIISGDTSQGFRSGSRAAESIYSHIGALEDAIVPQTLINGLLDRDYTTKDEFDTLISPLGLRLDTGSLNIGNDRFLKNVGLQLKLTNKADSVSKARFSGNDVSRYMQRQIAEFVKSGQPVVVAENVKQQAKAQIDDINTHELSTAADNNPDNIQDARLYVALFGVEDEEEYYTSKSEIEEEWFLGLHNLNPATDFKDNFNNPIDLKIHLKPSLQITAKDPMGVPPTIAAAEQGDLEAPSDLSNLGGTDTLAFAYEITGSGDCKMTVIIDRNGDGIFDRQGAGDNSTDTIKNDKVYMLASPGLSGTFEEPLTEKNTDPLEEFYKFRVMVESKGDGRLRDTWDGYVRPKAGINVVKILQILPYGTQGTVPLESDAQFVRLIKELDEREGEKEYKFIFPGTEESAEFGSSFDTVSESDFGNRFFPDGMTAEAAAENLLDTYDLIIAGTDFNTAFDNQTNGRIDMDDRAVRLLQTYITRYQGPVIFTNDVMSFVNGNRYLTPLEQEGGKRDLTVAEGTALDNALTEESGLYKLLKISKREAMALEEKNKVISHGGDGSVYIEKKNSPEKEPARVYKALVRPISEELVKNGRKLRASYIGCDDGKRRDEIEILPADGQGGSGNQGGGKKMRLIPSQLQSLMTSGIGPYASTNPVYTENYEGTDLDFYYAAVGYITEGEARALYQSQPEDIKSKATASLEMEGALYTFYNDDIHASLECDLVIPDEWIVPGKTIEIAGKLYHTFIYEGQEYLAYQTEGKENNHYGLIWQTTGLAYALKNVAGTADALYPAIMPWNQLATASLRDVLGMDRFSVTRKDMAETDKRDSGSSRRKKEVEELQGFTNQALIEYAYLPTAGSRWEGLVNKWSVYTEKTDTLLSLGAKPRTNIIESLNEGLIGRYPFSISGDEANFSEEKIEVSKSHGPLYQLDLERETGAGKLDDVTVWYTLEGMKQNAPEALYFSEAKKDGGNNYYLYSKGKTYYTGFSLKNKTGDSSGQDLVPDMEMKLFINTIYAALSRKKSSEAKMSREAVLKAVGTVTNISRSQVLGMNNRYVYYYDEYDDSLHFQFRLQKRWASEGENTPMTAGFKISGEGEEAFSVAALEENSFAMTQGAVPIASHSFPVVPSPVPDGTGETDGSLAEDPGPWFEFTIPFGEAHLTGEALDGKTLVIAVLNEPSGGSQQVTPGIDAIHAEIRLIMRKSFDLD